jgi:hypothetical protein
VGHHLLEWRARGKRRLPGEQVVHRAAQAVDVGSNVGLVGVVGLFRGDVIDRTQHQARASQTCRCCGFAGEASQAEIEDLHAAAGRQHQVVWLEVAVDHALLERILKSQRRLADVIAGAVHGKGAALLDQPAQVGPLHVFHHQEMRFACVLGVVGGDDVRVRQPGDGEYLAAETPQRGGVVREDALDDLECDGPL